MALSFRKFINDHVVKLAEKHPEVAIYVRPRRFRHPRMVAEYRELSFSHLTISPSIHLYYHINVVNGNSQIISLKNKKEEEIWHHVNVVFSSSGVKAEKLKKPWYTANPSIQGTWTPFLYK